MKANNFFGFESLTDFSNSLFRFSDWSFTSLIAFFGIITSLITSYMYDSPEAVWTLYALMAVDWITGIWKSMKNKEFVSYKIWRMPIYYLVISVLISLSWWMAKSYSIFFILPSLIICGSYSIYFISILENVGELGFLPKSLITIIKKRFGLKAIIDKFKNDDGSMLPSDKK